MIPPGGRKGLDRPGPIPVFTRSGGKGPTRRGRRGLLALAAVLLLLFLAMPALVELFADLLWFQELGLTQVLTTRIAARAAILATVALLAFAAIYSSARRAQRGQQFLAWVRGPQEPPVDISRTVHRATLLGSALFALLLGATTSAQWPTVLAALHRTAFGTADPIFGRDVSFYVFVLPLIAGVLGLLFTLGVLALGVALASYWMRREVALGSDGRLAASLSAARHLGLLGAALFALAALDIWLVKIPELLFSTTGPVLGASYTDLVARRPGLHVAAVAALIAGALLLARSWKGELARGALVAIGLFAVVSMLARGLVPAAVQRLVVAPTELTRERPYLRHHIDMTRRAWGLDRVQSRELSGAATISRDDLVANATTLDNVRLWDPEPLLQTFGQLQEIRTYYDFVSVDDDRYWIDGRYRQVLLSPRELNPASLPTRTFINEHLTFTHGMGLTLAPVNQATGEGLPVLFIQDLPPRSRVDLEVKRPGVYYGELTDSHVFVHTERRELDYPAGDENVFTRYAGSGGVRVGGLPRRALLAAYFGSMNVLLSQDIGADSRVLYHRQIATRASRALPFLSFDSDPYLVIRDDGTLAWMLDAYTTTGRYPYAARLGDGTSYMRNSVKVTIDAYDGGLAAWAVDAADPILATWARIFPGVFRPVDEMPEDLRRHIRYPMDLYRVQMGLYTLYHMDEPEEIYHREDQWQIPTMAQGNREVPFMRRIIMRLPLETAEEYISMTPFTPRQKDNLTAWVVARSDGDAYGQLLEYRFPRQSLVFGPRQVVNRINQDTEISRQLALWDQRGSTVIRGELMVLPIGEALIYVQPIFLRAEGGRIPEMKRVVVAYENQVVMEETFDEGLARIFGGDGEASAAGRVESSAAEQPAADRPDDDAEPATETAVPPGLARRAHELYRSALAAQRAGDWAAYGERVRELGEVLAELAAADER